MRRLLLAISIGLLYAPATLAVEPTPPIAFVSAPPALQFEDQGQGEVARINFLLQNAAPTGGQLQITLFPDNGDTPLTAISEHDFRLRNLSTALVLLRPAPTQLSVEGASVTAISAELWRPLDAKTPSGGQLVVRLSSTRPLGPAVAKLTEKGKPPLAFQQKSVTLSVTRLLGPLSRPAAWVFDQADWRQTLLYAGESVEIATRGESPDTKSALINSDSSGTANVTLQRKNNSRSIIAATDISRHGKYTGDLTLDPEAEEPKSLSTTLNVHDLILWPLLFLLAGSAFATVIVKRHDISRGRGLIQKTIKESVDPYLAARARNAQQPAPDSANRFYLNELVPTDRLPYPDKDSCGASNLTEVERLYCLTHKPDSDEALGDLVASVEETTARFGRWSKVETAATLVKDELAQLPASSPMHRDARDLLVITHLEPDDDKEASDQVAVLRAEARIAALYRHVRQVFDSQEEPWKATHRSLDPDQEVVRLGAVGDRTEAAMEKVELRLLTVAEWLRDPDAIPPDMSRDVLAGELSVLRANRSLELMYLDAPEDLHNLMESDRGPRPTVDTRSPDLIYAQVRRADWAVFWVAAALTGIVYISQQYDADYGSLEDYLLAFAAGAAVPTAVNWALLPFTRSYRVAAKKAAGPAANPS
jgi:hypothetical protein